MNETKTGMVDAARDRPHGGVRDFAVSVGAKAETTAGKVVSWPVVPWAGIFLEYDYRNAAIYLLLLTMDARGATLSEMAHKLFLGKRTSNFRLAKLAARSHLKRAQWLLENKFPPIMWSIDD